VRVPVVAAAVIHGVKVEVRAKVRVSVKTVIDSWIISADFLLLQINQ